MSRAVHSEEELKSLIPKLKIEPRTKPAAKANKAQTLRKTAEWTSDDHEVDSTKKPVAAQSISESDSSDETESEEGEVTDSEDDVGTATKNKPRSKFKAQPVEKPETRSKKPADKSLANTSAATSDEQDPKAKRLPRKKPKNKA